MAEKSEEELRREVESLLNRFYDTGWIHAPPAIRAYIDFLIKDREAHGRAAWERGFCEALARRNPNYERAEYDDIDWAKSEQKREVEK